MVTALLAIGAVAVYLMLADTRAAGHTAKSRSALYCAESGLAGARTYLGSNVASWGVMLDADPGNDPTGYPVTGDLDGDGSADWRVTLRDNDDEFPTDNPYFDTDGAVFMVSTCLASTDATREVMVLVSLHGGGTNYRTQAGAGGGNTGNSN
jgi:hypothetical protein